MSKFDRSFDRRSVATIASARSIVIEIQSDDAGNVTKRVQVEGNEVARSYAEAIATAMEAAVKSAIEHEGGGE